MFVWRSVGLGSSRTFSCSAIRVVDLMVIMHALGTCFTTTLRPSLSCVQKICTLLGNGTRVEWAVSGGERA